MAYPQAVVSIAFNDGPYVASPTWTDVTTYVRDMTVDRGRDDDWGVFDGSAHVVLDNRTRLFDPFYTSGTYYGKLLPRRQIKIEATWNGTTYPVFRGFIAGWPPAWTDGGKDSTVTISCFDAMQLLGSNNLPADWSKDYILSTSPRHYYPLTEPIVPYSTTTTLNDLGSYPLPATTTAYAVNGDQLAAGLVNTSLQGVSQYAAASAIGATSTASDYSVCGWFVFDPDTTYDMSATMGNTVWLLSYEPTTSTFLVYIYDFNGVPLIRQFRTVNTFDVSTPRHLAFTFNVTSKAITFYVNGVVQSMTTLGATSTLAFSYPEQIQFGSAQVQQFVSWNSIQTGTVFANIYKYSSALFPETTSARVNRIIANTPFPASLVSTPASPASSVLDITDDAPTASSELQKVADSEFAPLFVSKSGTLTLYQQNQIRTQTASIVSQGTYGAGGINIGQDIDLTYDGDSLRNTIALTMSQGGVYTQSNATSVAAYGSAEMSLDTEVQTYANAQAVSNIVTGWGGQVYPMASPFDVVLSPTADWSNALSRELNDRITLSVQPPTGNAITYPMLLQRISHHVLPGEWHTTFTGSARWAAVFILNQSTLGGTDLLG